MEPDTGLDFFLEAVLKSFDTPDDFSGNTPEVIPEPGSNVNLDDFGEADFKDLESFLESINSDLMTDQSMVMHAKNPAAASPEVPSSRPMKRALSEQETQSVPHQLSRNLPPGSTDYPPAKWRYVPSFGSYADMTDESHTLLHI
ncbi:hypothetical protein WMY93_018594 [Mugilogobius chulae]|uniref:Uncharacterized protein n=1 Tax=Mugilogobius chulae TaxID=88201 RepID=A0AAW0NPB6_9GOBI